MGTVPRNVSNVRGLTAPVGVTLLVSLVAGCGTAGGGASQSTTEAEQGSGGARAIASPAAGARGHPRGRPAIRRAPAASRGIDVSRASNDVVQEQPAPGSCHAIGTGLYSRPDPRCTPGALNPTVTQATIDRTICVPGWTDSVRPPESITEQEKAASIAAYGGGGSMGDYEYDHFVALELGGATNDPRNLWPEPGASPNPKDAVEYELNQKVCAGQMSLARAQRAIVANWVALAAPASPSAASGASTSSSASASQSQSAECTVSASYDAEYHDYDVYVHSNQPNESVTVTATDGHSARWHTDASGYADVYFDAGPGASGERVTAQVGEASCSTTL
jgi:hypothetical protein